MREYTIWEHPVSHALKMEDELRKGVKSVKEVCDESGVDYEEFIAMRADEIRRMKDLGLYQAD